MTNASVILTRKPGTCQESAEGESSTDSAAYEYIGSVVDGFTDVFEHLFENEIRTAKKVDGEEKGETMEKSRRWRT